MVQLDIIIKNQSDEVQQFLIFSDAPAYSANTGKAWPNVWGRSPGVGAQSGNTTFQIHEQYYAVCGMEKRALAINLQVSTSDSRSVQLGVDGNKGTGVTLEIQQGGAVFDKKKTDFLDKNGAFGIETKPYDLTQYSRFTLRALFHGLRRSRSAFCGLGMKNPVPDEEDVVPVSVWQAKPNQKYQITPKRVYYIATGKFTPGRIVNVTELGAYATIDFTGRKESKATIVFTNELSYDTVKYFFGEEK